MNRIKSMLSSIAKFFYQSQEFTLWLPGLAVLAVLAYVVLGAIVRVGPDALAWLAELPALCAYAAAWLAFSWLIKSLYLHDIQRDDEVDLQQRVLAGDVNARWLLVKDRLETFAALLLALAFFWPAR
jgi:hypothetical protein